MGSDIYAIVYNIPVSKFLLDEEAQNAPFDAQNQSWFSKPEIIFVLVAVLILGGSTIAKNLNIGVKTEFGKGLYKVRACDSWISIGLYPTAAQYDGYSRVDSVELIGLDPVKCANKRLRFQFFDSTTATALPMYVGTVTATSETGTARILTVFDTSTAYSGGTSAAYTGFAEKALTLINEANKNVGYDDGYLRISYDQNIGSWRIYLAQPLCLMSAVSRITVESA